jgi:oligopeptide transport system permease protein
MVAFLLRRLLALIAVMVVVAAATFWLMHHAPGGPWDEVKPVPAAVRANLNARFGLDKPVWLNPDAVRAARERGVANPLILLGAYFDSQFFNYLGGAVRLDLGPSYQSRGATNVRDVIAAKFPVSAKIGLVGLTFAVAVGVPLGVTGALRQGSWIDSVTLALSTFGIAVPGFVTGILLLVFLSSWFDVSPLRRPEEWAGFGPAYLLPGVVLGLGLTAVLVRLTRASLLETKRQDFVRTARAKGLRERQVVRGHLLRNGLIPVVTVLGPAGAELVTGSIIIETVFNAPGLGREFVDAISARDYSMIMGTTLFYAVVIALANVAVDLSYAALDPRIRVRS